MKLIAESSSTRAEWMLIEGESVLEQTFTEGINPYLQSRREISRTVRLNLPESYFKRKLEHVYFYGVGCDLDTRKDIVSASLIAQFKVPVTVESDLLGAARGLFGSEAGITCLIGTGSKSCFYDGNEITKNVLSAGYMLGDEGSKAALGKLFLADALKNLAPAGLIRDFYDKFRIKPEIVIESVYNNPAPCRFFATVSYFLTNYLEDDYVYDLFVKNIRDYFSRCICQYPYRDYPVRFTGPFPYRHSDIIEEVAREYDIEIDLFLETPMSGLVKYHAITN